MSMGSEVGPDKELMATITWTESHVARNKGEQDVLQKNAHGETTLLGLDPGIQPKTVTLLAVGAAVTSHVCLVKEGPVGPDTSLESFQSVANEKAEQ